MWQMEAGCKGVEVREWNEGSEAVGCSVAYLPRESASGVKCVV